MTSRSSDSPKPVFKRRLAFVPKGCLVPAAICVDGAIIDNMPGRYARCQHIRISLEGHLTEGYQRAGLST
jgi:hypothetical protein